MGIPLPSYKCKQALEDAQLRAAIAAIADCASASAEVQEIYAELAVCTPLFVVQDIYIRILTAAFCFVSGGGQDPFSPVTQLWDGTDDVTIDDETNLLRLTAPVGAGREITLPDVSLYPGGLYVAIDLGANLDVHFGLTIVPAGADTIDGQATMVPVMGATYVVFTQSGTGNWTYQISNNDDPRFYRTFTVLASFGGDVANPHFKVSPASYNGNDTSWVGHDPTVGLMGGFMWPINANDPLRCTDKFNIPTDFLMRHPLSSNVAQPVVQLGPGAGSIDTDIAIEGNDTAGWVRVTTGSDASGTGEIWNLSFDANYYGPPAVIIQAADDDTRIGDGNFLYAPLGSTTIADFHAYMPTGKSLAVSSTYRWRYHTFGGL